MADCSRSNSLTWTMSVCLYLMMTDERKQPLGKNSSSNILTYLLTYLPTYLLKLFLIITEENCDKTEMQVISKIFIIVFLATKTARFTS